MGGLFNEPVVVSRGMNDHGNHSSPPGGRSTAIFFPQGGEFKNATCIMGSSVLQS